VKLYYKCGCMENPAEIECLERGPRQETSAWMENQVARAISSHHAATHPRCVATVMEYVNIPVADNASIGCKNVLYA
jgi:hypothetical protein